MSTKLLPKVDTFFRSALFENNQSINLLLIINFIWISGAVVKITKLIRDHYYLRKSLRFCPTKTDIEPSVFLEVASEYKLPKQLKIIVTTAISIPMVFGFFFPTIVFPMNNFASEEQYFIIRHELEHFRNRDIWIKTVIELICALYWWNPLVYVFRERSDRILEINVDLSISKTWKETETLKYLEFLLSTYKRSSPFTYKKVFSTLSIVDGKNCSAMTQRFELLFFNKKPKFSKGRILFTCIVSVLMLVISFSCIVQPQYSLPTDCESHVYALTSDNAYLVKRPDGKYDVYVCDIGYFTTIQEIEEPYTKLSIK